jgi:predicted alpha/beta superfamily hydrolase
MARREPAPPSVAAWRRIQPSGDRDIYHHASAALGDTLEITVVPPMPAGEGRSPVLYVLDPFLTLDTVVGWSRVYGRYSEGAAPPCFVVGIGHPIRDDADFSARRIRDLTPTPNTGSEWKPPLGAGQGLRLIETIATEVVPLVEGTYAAAGTDRTVIGWSLGGLFALTALFHRPDLFQRYLVVSPSLWWDRRSVFADEAAWAASHADLSARLFMAIGSEEEKPGGGWLSEGFSDEIIAWFRQVANFRAFSRRLKARRYPGLRLDTVVFPDEYHMTVYPAAIARGLVKLFER